MGTRDGKGGRPLLVECGSEGNMMIFFLKSFLKWLFKRTKGREFTYSFCGEFLGFKNGFYFLKNDTRNDSYAG
jgi:hypothetical protein